MSAAGSHQPVQISFVRQPFPFPAVISVPCVGKKGAGRGWGGKPTDLATALYRTLLCTSALPEQIRSVCRLSGLIVAQLNPHLSFQRKRLCPRSPVSIAFGCSRVCSVLLGAIRAPGSASIRYGTRVQTDLEARWIKIYPLPSASTVSASDIIIYLA